MLSTRIELAGALILEAVLTANNALTVGCNAVAAIPFFTKFYKILQNGGTERPGGSILCAGSEF